MKQHATKKTPTQEKMVNVKCLPVALLDNIEPKLAKTCWKKVLDILQHHQFPQSSWQHVKVQTPEAGRKELVPFLINWIQGTRSGNNPGAQKLPKLTLSWNLPIQGNSLRRWLP